MGHITFFQFLRRCLLLDAEAYTPPQEILRETKRRLCEGGTGGTTRIGPSEQAERLSGAGRAGAGGREEDRSPLREEDKK